MRLFIVALLVSSCAQVKEWISPYGDWEALNLEGYEYYSGEDFNKQYTHLGNIYLKGKRREVGVSQYYQGYLRSIEEEIRKNNKLFFEKEITVKFHIIREKTPFYFSLPDGRIFLSLGLLQKYLKQEGHLYSIIAYELIRIEKRVYLKNIIIPTENISTERMISLNRLPLNDKINVHKWAFYLLGRSGVDQSEYLSWIQLQNKNTLDFSLHIGDVKSISREETLSKAFVAGRFKTKLDFPVRNSTKKFYQFLNKMNRTRL